MTSVLISVLATLRGIVRSRAALAPRGARAAPSTAGPATVTTATAAPCESGPVALGVAVTLLERLANGARDREAGDRHRLAPHEASGCSGRGRVAGATGDRPSPDVRALIRTMSHENPLWGAPRIHGELLKLGSRSLRRRSRSTWRAGHAAVTVLAHLPHESRPADRGRRFLRRPDRHVPAACSCWSSSRTSAAESCMSPSRTIRRRPGRRSSFGSVSVGSGTALSHSRPGSRVSRGHRDGEGDGH